MAEADPCACPKETPRYECQKCLKSVCYCHGDDVVAVCDGCWFDLDRAGFTAGDMAAAYGNGDHTIPAKRDGGHGSCGWLDDPHLGFGGGN
jgi:hypothetical protein